MSTIPYTAGLHDLGRGTWAWLQPSGSWGLSNAGLIVGGHDAILVDTQYTIPLTRALLASVNYAYFP